MFNNNVINIIIIHTQISTKCRQASRKFEIIGL